MNHETIEMGLGFVSVIALVSVFIYLRKIMRVRETANLEGLRFSTLVQISGDLIAISV